MPQESAQEAGRVSLLVTCLADQFFPEVAEAAVRAIRRLGVRVDCPSGQTCCGLPHYNNGFPDEARRLAERNLDLFGGEGGGDGPVVIPSGSCGWMCKSVYPSLFEGDPWIRDRAIRFSDRVTELSAFLASRPEGGGGTSPNPGKASARSRSTIPVTPCEVWDCGTSRESSWPRPGPRLSICPVRTAAAVSGAALP